ncbi:imidazole glycerol phosphate synthase subunit HisH [Candidatus Borrarchaeum sp.]|uniref:imidazole glycerol phosphate synthase subunit HisH n=1 Tax=Candidatus Borrarchaeum sp. TaxID=2846742 RepID=UPI00257F73C0|nr:imidazole glycerol phosphate synthase subunit HisH [Candidatus Borrarchaeum sp.]
MVRIAIINYGAGNLRSISNGLRKAGSEPQIITTPSEIKSMDAVILPGVGAFRDAINNLKEFIEPIKDAVNEGKTLLGICLGLQLLFTESEEGGLYQGMDLLPGRVVKLPDTVKIPQIGWNDLEIVKKDNPLCNGRSQIKNGSFVYFVHSYYSNLTKEDLIMAKTEYGVTFPSIISDGQIFATQFHPEKSGEVGLKMLENFVDFIKK